MGRSVVLRPMSPMSAAVGVYVTAKLVVSWVAGPGRDIYP